MATIRIVLHGVLLDGPTAGAYMKKTTQKTEAVFEVDFDSVDMKDNGITCRIMAMDLVYNMAQLQYTTPEQSLTTTSSAHINLSLGFLRKDGTPPTVDEPWISLASTQTQKAVRANTKTGTAASPATFGSPFTAEVLCAYHNTHTKPSERRSINRAYRNLLHASLDASPLVHNKFGITDFLTDKIAFDASVLKDVSLALPWWRSML